MKTELTLLTTEVKISITRGKNSVWRKFLPVRTLRCEISTQKNFARQNFQAVKILRDDISTRQKFRASKVIGGQISQGKIYSQGTLALY